ncbi:MAG: signal peptidase II [Paludibacteraceae bacterium]|nr:signal peptidase II [Paludibacteraceae bacterium]
MSVTQKQVTFVTALIISLIVLDQALKLWVHANIPLHSYIDIAPFFKLSHQQNPGMAFSMRFMPPVVQTIFRILASGAILAYLIHLIRKGTSLLMCTCLSLVFAGATGNIIDNIFYDYLFYGGEFFKGKVVDMLYFPLIEGRFWNWIPWVGGEDFIFFSPVFNLADSAICVGVFLTLVFQKKLFQ